MPKPSRSIPIWLGGHGEVAFDRAARLADGFIFFGGSSDQVVQDWNRLRDRVRALGRSAEQFGADWVLLHQSGVSDLKAEVDAWRDAGGTHVSLDTMNRGLDSASAHVGHLTAIAEALGL